MSTPRLSRLPLGLALLEVAAEADERGRSRLREQVTLPLVVLVVAVLYFLWVALLGLRVIALPSLEPTITPADWAVSAAVLFLILLVVLFLEYRRTQRPGYQAEGAAAPRAAYAPAPAQTRWPADEMVVTAESVQGRRVLEYSRPPKSEHPQAVYAKCLVPVDSQLALRVEDLVAEAKE